MQTTLSKDIEKKVKKIGKADILIGIPSYNNNVTIGHVMRAARLGLTKYFPQLKSILKAILIRIQFRLITKLIHRLKIYVNRLK